MNEQFKNPIQQDEIDLKKEFLYFSFFWPYFLVAIVVALLCGFVYLRYTPKIYSASGQIQFQKTDADPTAFLAENAGSLFDFDKINLDNEIALINSYRILSQVVENQGLNYEIRRIGNVKSTLLFNGDFPFTLTFDPTDTTATTFGTLEVKNGKAEVQFDDSRLSLLPGETVTLNGWTITLGTDILEEDYLFEFAFRSTQSAVNSIKRSLNAKPLLFV